MERVIKEIKPLSDYVLEVVSARNGSVIRLQMKQYLDRPRFYGLRSEEAWASAETDGFMVRWPGVAELSFEEIAKRVFDY